VGVGQFRLWPHKLLGEGHFAAVMRKADGEAEDIPEEPAQKLPKTWSAFAKELKITLPEGKAVSFGSSLYWASEEMPDLRGIKVMRPGLELGEMKKDRFEPAHALAICLKTASRTVCLSADSPEIAAYMRGEVLPADERGWTLVRVDTYSIGCGKCDGKVLKNHYPKGLRR
jgi:NOL1/NOP2/fmu family ribosome biogenesis protein